MEGRYGVRVSSEYEKSSQLCSIWRIWGMGYYHYQPTSEIHMAAHG